MIFARRISFWTGYVFSDGIHGHRRFALTKLYFLRRWALSCQMRYKTPPT